MVKRPPKDPRPHRGVYARRRPRSAASAQEAARPARFALAFLLAFGLAGCPLDVGFLASGAGESPDAPSSTSPNVEGAAEVKADTPEGGSAGADGGAPLDVVQPEADAANSAADAAGTMGAIADGAPDVAMSAPDVADVAAMNIIANPSCDSGTSPWYTFGSNQSEATLMSTTLVTHGDSHACWVSNRTASFQGPTQDITAAAVAGQTYSVSAWVTLRAAGDAGADPSLMESVQFTMVYSCMQGDAGVDSYVQAGSVVANGATWSELTGTLTIPTCTLSGDILVYLEGPPSGVDLFADDVTLVP